MTPKRGSGDVEHALERDAGPFGRVRVHRDLVDDLTPEEVVEAPGQVRRVDAEHRRARAHERVERDHRAVGVLGGQALDQVDLGADADHGARRRRLLTVLSRLVDQGNTVLVIEHNLDVIKTADWIIDLGPEGGTRGGTIVATGTPEDVARVDASHTGQYLRGMLQPPSRRRKAG